MVWDVPTDVDEDGKEFDPSAGADFNNVNQAGIYHMQVVNADEAGGKSGADLVVDYEVLGGKPPGQEGRSFRDWFHASLASRNRVLKWALACGITTEEEGKKAAAEKRPLTLDPRKAIGQQLVIEVESDKDQHGNPRLKCGWGIYSIDDPKVQGVLNKGVLPTKGDSADDPFGVAGGRSKASNPNDGATADQGKEGPVTDDAFGNLFD